MKQRQRQESYKLNSLSEREINSILARIGTRLDNMDGIGQAKDAHGNRIALVADAIQDYDALNLSQGVRLVEEGIRFRNVTDVNESEYTLKTDDYDLSVLYTATGAVTITIPELQNKRGRTIFICDDGNNATTNNITIQDDLTPPNILFIINADGAAMKLRRNTTEWRIR